MTRCIRRRSVVKRWSAFTPPSTSATSKTLLGHLAPGVDWPNGMTGGRVHGRDAVRAYWENQWKEIDPIVEPMRIETDAVWRKARVLVDQLVRSLGLAR